MKGLIAHPEIKDTDVDRLVLLASKNGKYPISVITPNGENYSILLEVTKPQKGWSCVCVDTWNSGYDITDDGVKIFYMGEKNIPDQEDRKEPFCGKRVMRIDVKETGEGMVLAYILNFLEDGKNIERIS